MSLSYKQRVSCLIVGLVLGGYPLASSLPAYARSCRTSSVQQVSSDNRLTQAIDAILDAPEMQSAFQGLYIVRLRDGKPLYTRNADRVFLPASNNKLLTSFAALETLPLDFTYRTQVRMLPPNTGSMKATQRGSESGKQLVDDMGVLHGDLVIIGGGDPTLTLNDLDSLAQQVAKYGIHMVLGIIRYDDSRYDRQWLGDGWTWDDEAAAYSAQISALNVNANCLDVQVWPGKRPGVPVRVQTSPTTDYVAFINNAITTARPINKLNAKSVDRTPVPVVNIDRERGVNRILITGNMPMAQNSTQAKDEAEHKTSPTITVPVTVEDPARFTSTLFLKALRRAGIRVGNGHIARFEGAMETLTAGTLVADHASTPLADLLVRMNKPSDNLMAECLLKAVGAFGQLPVGSAETTNSGLADIDVSPPRVGTSGNGGTGARLAQKAFLAAGFQANGVHQADGSGLSRLNYVSPHNLVRLLTVAHERTYWPAFYASLPIAGVDGTLRNRLKSTAAQNNCRAKTGTLSHVSSLTGYVTDRSGDLLAFSIIINNNLNSTRTSTAVQDRIVQILSE